ncbi:acyl-CoA thioesterase [Shewanella surugensis]|uniref:Acyl-CoA thioesterase n=1 Tax=Shewanella surugensis TaxID=212020 RepID=A0ABT0L8K3_9GAMM|nr:thioesterase family protein [Shewanella surugensis]MCL1124027.1 acyl-CoA thioesterase [Shewanella surugensis]
MLSHEVQLIIRPRFCETDALGHINNTVIPMWFEAAREPIFEILNPGQDLKTWNVILAGFNIAFSAPTFYGEDVVIKTCVSRIGNSSFVVTQACWQGNKKTAEAQTTMVFYDYETDKSQLLTDEIRTQLGQLMRVDA